MKKTETKREMKDKPKMKIKMTKMIFLILEVQICKKIFKQKNEK